MISIGQHWLEVAHERIIAGENETDVLKDYGYESSGFASGSDSTTKERHLRFEIMQLKEKINLAERHMEGMRTAMRNAKTSILEDGEVDEGIEYLDQFV